MTKTCNLCGAIKPLLDFYKHKKNKFGVSSECKACAIKRSKKYYQKIKNCAEFKEKRKLKNSEWNKTIKAKQSKEKWKKKAYGYQKEYYEKNREKIISRANKYYHSNKDKLLKNMYKRKKSRLATDNLFKLRESLSHRIRMAFRGHGWSKQGSSKILVGTDYKTLQAHLLKTFIINYGRAPRKNEKLHIDHIVPNQIAKTPKQAALLQHYTNLQWLTKKDNLTKGARLDWESPYQKYLKEQRRA